MVVSIMTSEQIVQIVQSTYVEVLGVNLAVLGHVEILLCDEHTLFEEVLVDEFAVSLGNQPVKIAVSTAINR
jgi:hypothetical protein